MNAVSRELALNFLEHRKVHMGELGEIEEKVLGNNYLVFRGEIIAKWEKQTELHIHLGSNSKMIRDRLNAILMGYGCCLTIQLIQGKTFLINECELLSSPNHKIEMDSEYWYYIRKDGFFVRLSKVE